MNRLFLIIFLLILGINSIAQKKIFTVKDVEIGIRRELAPSNLTNLQWRGNSEFFTFQEKQNVLQQSINNSKPEVILTVEQLNKIITSDTLKYIPNITWENDKEFHFLTTKNWYAILFPELKIISSIKIPQNAEHLKICYAIKKIACTQKNNVYILSENNPPVQVTSDNNENIVNGDIVSRNEFGINEGLFWSPKGNFLAFYRKDNSKVTDYPLVDITSRIAQVNKIKYPMAGMHGENVSVGIYSINDNTTTFIEKDDTTSEKYLTNISWVPDEKQVYIQVLNHAQNHMKFNSYNVSNGLLIKTLFEEDNEKYVEPLNPVVFLNKVPGSFLYQSRNNGYNHFFVYNSEGKMLKQLTQGLWEVTGIIKLDKSDNLYYTSTEASAIEEHVYKINVSSGNKVKLTTEPGIHQVLVNDLNSNYIDNYTNSNTPHKIDLIGKNGKLIRNLLTSENKLSAFDMPEMTLGTITAADGVTPLYYRLIKPVNFDPSKKYPVIVYVYGGPHVQLISNQWLGGARLWDFMMAQKGYVVFTLDSRGSGNRGLAFENVIHRQCGQTEMLDQIKGVEFLKNLPYTDSTRFGVHGWSYGGFMTTSLMVNYPNVFKVGVAGGPVIDWKYYEVMYGERYMDTPQENPEGYDKTSLTSKAKNLKGKLMIIHGAIDPTVVWQNSLVFIDECIKNNIPIDYFVYPEAEHNVRGADRVHLMQKITDYFDQNL